MKSFSILCSLLAVILCGCATTTPEPAIVTPALNIYQPSVLVIPKGVPIMTTEGTYIPQTDEIWHSDKRYRDLERTKY